MVSNLPLRQAVRPVSRLWTLRPINPILPAALRLGQGLVGAVLGHDPFQILGGDNGVELVDVDVIGPQPLQAEVDVLGHGLFVPGQGLAGDDDLVPEPLQGGPHLQLGVVVFVGRVEKVDSPIKGPPDHGRAFFKFATHNRDAAHAQNRNFQAGPPQNGFFHDQSTLLKVEKARFGLLNLRRSVIGLGQGRTMTLTASGLASAVSRAWSMSARAYSWVISDRMSIWPCKTGRRAWGTHIRRWYTPW